MLTDSLKEIVVMRHTSFLISPLKINDISENRRGCVKTPPRYMIRLPRRGAATISGLFEGEDRGQATLFPECIDDYIAEDSAVRVNDVFIDELDLSWLGFRTMPEATGRPGYHPALLLKLFI